MGRTQSQRQPVSDVEDKRFLRKPPPVLGRLQSSTPAPELVVLVEYASHGSAWAESARREVWLLVDTPSIEIVQALSCLNLYWFAINNMDRARINAAFPDAYAKNAWEEAHLLPLPTAYDKIHKPSDWYYMDREWKCQSMTPASGPSETQYTPFVVAEYMKLMGIWVRVQIMTRNSRSQPNILEIEHLSHLAKGIYESTHFPTFPARAEVTEHQTGVLGLHSLYHMCQIIVLCPLVSLFSGRNVNNGHPSDNTRIHAESVTKHALSHCKLIHDYVAAKSDISKLSPLVGFGSFVATSILLTLLKSRARRHQDKAKVSQSLLRMIQDTVDILNILQTYWEPLEQMAKKLHQAVEQLVRTSEVADDGSVPVSSRTVEVPLTGVNSPAAEEDIITTTYIDSPGHQSGPRPLDPVPNPNMEIPGRISQRPLHLEGSSDFGWRESDMFNPDLVEGLSVLNEDLDPIYFSMADWDMDLLSEFPVQMA
ncbi:fungal transcriptional regulatory [Fusarium longipes]|uniref:Fungal transcriptional regulatory n=1 Tax=Fusarium longipes TaxID=694270 RepID=A0A395T9K4_9HYPO|nr:fungal transcriptional regulatory [Fusarium longipes]